MKHKIIFGTLKAGTSMLYVQKILCMEIIAKYEDNEKRNRIQFFKQKEYERIKEWMITIQKEMERRAIIKRSRMGGNKRNDNKRIKQIKKRTSDES